MISVRCLDNTNPFSANGVYENLTVGDIYEVERTSYVDGKPSYYFLRGVGPSTCGFRVERFEMVSEEDVPMGRPIFTTLNP
jgi:hypothetical protein